MAVREMKMIPDEVGVVGLALLGLRIGVEVGDGNSVSVKLPQRNVFLFQWAVCGMSIAKKSPDMIRLVSIDSISKEIVEAKRKGIIHGYVEKPISDRSVLEAVRECRKQL